MALASYEYLGGGGGGGDDDDVAKSLASAMPDGVLLKFGAKWCGPCRAVHAGFVQLAQQSPVPCFQVDIEEDPEGLASAFSIEKLPTFLLLRSGSEAGRVEGASLEQVRQLLLAPQAQASSA